MNVNIYGAGISGLTVAHELVEKGFNVTVYDKNNIVGGMARSVREKGNNMPTEHSWRGYGPFYYNSFDILDRIPIKEVCNDYIIDNKNRSNMFVNELKMYIDHLVREIKNRIDSSSSNSEKYLQIFLISRFLPSLSLAIIHV